MALNMTQVVSSMRTLIDEVTGFERVFAASSSDQHSIPGAINEFPTVVVYPGETIDYILTAGQHRHTYEVNVDVFCRAGGDTGASAAQAMGLVELVLEKFAVNIGGTWANSCLLIRNSGLATLEYNGIDYLGWRLTYRVSEQASVTAAKGA